MTKKDDSIFRFLSPEEIDNIIKAKKPKLKWSPEEKMLRNTVILDYIISQGLSKWHCAQQISDRWNKGMSTCYRYIEEALASLAEVAEKDRDSIREKHIAQLEDMLQQCLEDKNIDTALKVQDQLAKIRGLYINQQEISLKDDKIQIKFE